MNSSLDRMVNVPSVKDTKMSFPHDLQLTTTILAEKFVDCFVDTATTVWWGGIGIAVFFGGLLIILM
jgi:uncharacterized membrane protein